MMIYKRLIMTFSFILLSALTASDISAQLSREAQLDLIGYYKLVLEGRASIPTEAQSLSELDESSFPIKCGTPITTSWVFNFDKIDKFLVDKHSLALWPRPTETDESFDSPAGYFKIHFTRTGSHACYQANSTTGGIPNYIIGIARICDSVYTHIIGQLGYPAPPQDGGYPSGIDNRFDVYVTNLGGNFFGLTYPDSLSFSGPTSLDATSFIGIDNDYQEIGFGPYRANPLNAVRVTIAHEYFHAVQFGMDYTETEIDTSGGFDRRYWYEMSAVWMEEEIYDNINDYYTTLPFFFNRPRSSIQQFASPVDFHPYASCVFPIFLTEKYGTDIMRAVWIKCGQLGAGPDMLEAVDLVVDSITSGAENFRSTFAEFTLWNFFTGSRAGSAPGGVGYQERAFYPEIPESSFTSINQYPSTQLANTNPKSPAVNSAAYFKLNNTRAIFYTDSADTQLRVSMALGAVVADSALPQGWNIYRLGQLDSNPSIYVDTNGAYADNANYFLRTNNPRQYRSITYILAPASWKWEAYKSSNYDTRFGYIITDSLALSPDKPSAAFMPYPNPANISQMGGANLTFRFQIATDSIGSPIYSSLYTQIDMYNVAGELVNTIETDSPPIIVDPISGDAYFEVEWDMRSQRGGEVASGVYICYIRLFESGSRENLLDEKMSKVLIVR